MFGSSSPSMVRSVDCHVNVSLSTGARMLVAVSSPPSACTPDDSITQRLPSRVQAPSPKPPSSSKIHDRSWPVRGSLRITCVALRLLPGVLIEIWQRIEFFLSSQEYTVRTLTSSLLLSQVPM